MHSGHRSYLADTGTALGDEAHDDGLLAAGYKAKAHCWVALQDDAAWLRCRLIVAVEVRQLVGGGLVQVAAKAREIAGVMSLESKRVGREFRKQG